MQELQLGLFQTLGYTSSGWRDDGGAHILDELGPLAATEFMADKKLVFE